MAHALVDITSRVLALRSFISHFLSAGFSQPMRYHVHASLVSMGWLPLVCKEENETPSLNPTGMIFLSA